MFHWLASYSARWGITHAARQHVSPFGPIETARRLTGGSMEPDLTVPGRVDGLGGR